MTREFLLELLDDYQRYLGDIEDCKGFERPKAEYKAVIEGLKLLVKVKYRKPREKSTPERRKAYLREYYLLNKEKLNERMKIRARAERLALKQKRLKNE